ncbi:MAG: nucleoside-diphosphate kinase [Bacteroidales bacterium]|nr:nucleoside-diphosphate kinase [Bacteroidales bacterium]
MERTLVILKPSALQRRLVGEILSRFEKKGFILCGMKMMQLDEQILDEHYAHLVGKAFYPRIKKSMMKAPVVVCCLQGVNAIPVVHAMAGVTNGRNAAPGTIRGDFSMSVQENVIHTSDSAKTAQEEINRFFAPEELFDYDIATLHFLYSDDEVEMKE